MTQPCFELRGVGQVRGGRTVLHDVDVTIPRHLITVLCGPSGGGKTSLLRLLNRLDDPVRGEVLLDGSPIVDYEVTELRRRVALVFQSPVMFSGTVSDNLAVAAELGSRPAGQSVHTGHTDPAGPADPADLSDPAGPAGPAGQDVQLDQFDRQANEVLLLAELEPSLLERPGGELSVGQKQRVNLARALMTSPQVLLLDEPTSALDPETSRALMKTIKRLSKDRRLTIIVATHRVEEAQDYAQHALVLREGRVIDSGDAGRVLSGLSDPDTTSP